MKRPLILGGPYEPTPNGSRLPGYGSPGEAREAFEANRPAVLEKLLETRYQWMQTFMPGPTGIEVGGGAGFSQYFLRDPAPMVTDTFANPWLSHVVDAMHLPFRDNSLDFLIAVDVIHHLAHPVLFFEEVHRALRPGGRLILKEPLACLPLRAALRVLQHEGFHFGVDVLSRTQPCTDPHHPWMGNNAVANLLLERLDDLSCMGLHTIHTHRVESFLIYLSGGVSANGRRLTIPRSMVSLLWKLDVSLARCFPNLLASGLQWVLEKR